MLFQTQQYFSFQNINKTNIIYQLKSFSKKDIFSNEIAIAFMKLFTCIEHSAMVNERNLRTKLELERGLLFWHD